MKQIQIAILGYGTVGTGVARLLLENGDLLDAGMIFGTGFAPFRGGPVHHLEAQGSDKLLQQLRSLQKLRGDRFRPDPGWEILFKNQGEPSA